MVSEEQELDSFFMELALQEALKAFEKHEVPVGAVLVKEGQVIARAGNRVEELQDAGAHAEMLCMRSGGALLSNWRLLETTLYVTLEPCSMCLGAALLARVKRIVWGARDVRHGACGSWVNLLALQHPTHKLEVVGGVLGDASSSLLKQFFKLRRNKKHEQCCR